MSKALGAIAFVGAAGGLYYLWRENERQKADFYAEQDALFHQANLQLQQQQAEQRPPSNPWAPVLTWGLDQVFNGTKSNKSGGGLSGFLDGLFGRKNAGSGQVAPMPVAVNASRPNGPAGVDFAAHERQYGLPSGYLYRTAQIESALNPNAKNPNSSAGGLFQFIDATARHYGLKNRYDPEEATDAASRLARDNANYLRRKLGREPTAAELYLAHQQGAGGAAKLLADPNRRASEVVGSKAVRLNGGNESMTSGQFADKWISKFNRGYEV